MPLSLSRTTARRNEKTSLGKEASFAARSFTISDL